MALAVHRFVTEHRPAAAVGRFGVPGKLLSWAATFVFVLVTWVFFRARNFSDASAMLRRMMFIGQGGVEWYYVPALAAIALATVLHVWVLMRRERDLRLDLTRPVAWPALTVLLLLVLLYAPFGTNPFIYFQF